MSQRVNIHPTFWCEEMFLSIDLETMTFRWAATVEDDQTWVLGPNDASGSLNTLARLSGIQLRTDPGVQFLESFRQLGTKQIHWRHAIPKAQFNAFVTGLMGDIKNVIGQGCVTYHTEVFRCTQA